MRKLAVTAVLLLAACSLAPDMKVPDMHLPTAYKEGEKIEDGAWKTSDASAQIPQEKWWEVFGHATLNAWQEQAMKDNPSLEAAAQRVAQARAQAGIRESDLYPSVAAGVGPSRELPSAARFNGGGTPKPRTTYDINGTITYEVDVMGRYSGRLNAAEKDAEAQQNLQRAAQLMVQADVAQTYFTLLAQNSEVDLQQKIIAVQQEQASLAKKRMEIGEASDLEVAQADATLAASQSDLAALELERAQTLHRAALLLGTTPPVLPAPEDTLKGAPLAIPAGLPSSLLERRPDIKAAEDAIAAANERIGVARTGYFPIISLTANGGLSSTSLSDLFNWSSRTWLLGPLAGTMITAPIFEGGKLAATLASTKAVHQEAVANYRAAVLQAFKEVEDNLAATTQLSKATADRETALNAAKRANRIARERYKNGDISYLEKIEADRIWHLANKALVQTRGQHYVATVQLVRALGGLWQSPASEAPQPSTSPESFETTSPKAKALTTPKKSGLKDLPQKPKHKAKHTKKRHADKRESKPEKLQNTPAQETITTAPVTLMDEDPATLPPPSAVDQKPSSLPAGRGLKPLPAKGTEASDATPQTLPAELPFKRTTVHKKHTQNHPARTSAKKLHRHVIKYSERQKSAKPKRR